MTDDIITISAGAPPSRPHARRVRGHPHRHLRAPNDLPADRTERRQGGPAPRLDVRPRGRQRGHGLGASTSSGPKSKTYAWLTALLGGTPPAVGQIVPEVPARRARGARDDRDRRGRLGEDREPLGPPEGARGGPGRRRPGRGSCPARGRAAGRRRRPAALLAVMPAPESVVAAAIAADRAGLRRVRPEGGREGPGDGARLQERDDAPGLDPAAARGPGRRELRARLAGRPAPSASSCATSTTAAVPTAPGATGCSTSSLRTGRCPPRRSRRRPRAAATPSTAGRPTCRSPRATSCSASPSAGPAAATSSGPAAGSATASTPQAR